MSLKIKYIVEYDDGQRNQTKVFTNLTEAKACAALWNSRVKKVTCSEEYQ
jgi:hypothetical protein